MPSKIHVTGRESAVDAAPGRALLSMVVANGFARESHMDELAHAVSIDPLEFRLKN
jgi:CO/xanthine dehydrogenase Mo-binding subunit